MSKSAMTFALLVAPAPAAKRCMCRADELIQGKVIALNQFVCPTWGDFTVIVVKEREIDSSAAYEPQLCVACGRVHFVSPVTGLVLKRPPRKPEIVAGRCRPAAPAPNSSRPLRD